jgi:hypothetical protein
LPGQILHATEKRKNIGGGHNLCNFKRCARTDPFGLDTMNEEAGLPDCLTADSSRGFAFMFLFWSRHDDAASE